MSGFFMIFWFFFKVNSGVFLHSRVATLETRHVIMVHFATDMILETAGKIELFDNINCLLNFM